MGIVSSAQATPIMPSDQITLAGRTIYNDGNLAIPDSLRIQTFKDGSEVYDDWHNSGDATTSAIDDWLVFVDQFQDIDGAGGNGHYLVMVRAYDDDSSLYTPFIYNFQSGLNETVYNMQDSLHLIVDSLMAALDSLQSQDDWVSSLGVSDNIGINLDDINGTLDATEIGDDALTSEKVADNFITAEKIYTTACAEIAYHIWTYTTQNRSLTHFDEDDMVIDLDNVAIGSVVDSVLIDISANLDYADTIANRVLEDSLSYRGGSGQSGSGAYSYLMVAIDSTTDQVIPGANMVMRNIDQSALVALGTTDTQGEMAFNLDSDSFLVVSYAPGYIFESYDTVVVSGAGSDTVYAYRFDPGDPADPDLCRLYGYIYDIAGNPEEDATVTAWLPSGVLKNNSTIIAPFKVEAFSDSTGYFYLDLVPNSLMIPDTSKYEIVITLTDGTVLRERVAVPDLSEWLMSW
jgi:hypothetical protein